MWGRQFGEGVGLLFFVIEGTAGSLVLKVERQPSTSTKLEKKITQGLGKYHS